MFLVAGVKARAAGHSVWDGHCQVSDCESCDGAITLSTLPFAVSLSLPFICPCQSDAKASQARYVEAVEWTNAKLLALTATSNSNTSRNDVSYDVTSLQTSLEFAERRAKEVGARVAQRRRGGRQRGLESLSEFGWAVRSAKE